MQNYQSYKIYKKYVFLLLCLLGNNLFGQIIKSKTLPQPRFFVLGLDADNFPKLNGDWSDTLALNSYGIEIDHWMQKNMPGIEQAREIKSKDNGLQINSTLFKSLNDDEKTRFKEVAKLLSFIIKGQKNKMMIEYFRDDKEKSKQDFYQEIEQIYFIHKSDLSTLFKMIKT